MPGMYDMFLWWILLVMLSARVDTRLGVFLSLLWLKSPIHNVLLKYVKCLDDY